jgi:hypothetical protein
MIFAYILLGLEQGMGVALAQPGLNNTSPGLLLILMVFIGLWAPSTMVVWCAMFLGLLYDLSHPVLTADAQRLTDAAIIGPGAIAFILAGVAMLRMRGLVYRGSLLSIAIFTFITGLIVHLAIVLIFSVRGWSFLFLPGEHLSNWSWSGQLVSRFFNLLYTSLLALPIGWCLLRASSMFGFEPTKGAAGRR